MVDQRALAGPFRQIHDEGSQRTQVQRWSPESFQGEGFCFRRSGTRPAKADLASVCSRLLLYLLTSFISSPPLEWPMSIIGLLCMCHQSMKKGFLSGDLSNLDSMTRFFPPPVLEKIQHEVLCHLRQRRDRIAVPNL